MKKQQYDKLAVEIYDNRQAMGEAAAADIEQAILEVLAAKNSCTIIFAAAPSQREVLEGLAQSSKIDWTKIHAFHMDEYIGLPKEAPQGFANFLQRALFSQVPLGKVSIIDGTARPEEECERYTALLQHNPADIVVMGIGENGHIAFNDPPVANFRDDSLVKIVELDQECRQQQVNDGCFSSLSQVPTTALTLTVPALMSAQKCFCIVPAATKAKAVSHTLKGPISETCPASILRTHPNAILYLDTESAGQL